MVRINDNDPVDLSGYQDDELPETFSQEHIHGQVERRPGILFLTFTAVTAVGFIVGALFTLAILSGYIEVDPKAIKSTFKAIIGKN